MELLQHLAYFIIINIIVVLLGFIVVKYKITFLSWLISITSIGAINYIFWDAHPVIRMLTIIATTFTSMKVIAVTESYKNKPLSLKFYQWLAFAIGWAGMRAEPFETLGANPVSNAWPMIRFGITRVLAGLLLIALAHAIVVLPLNHTLHYILVSSILLIGLSLILHFGLLSISAGMWRLSGVNTYYLFREPAKATSLTEFWSKRWNIAFSEMTSVAIFRPLRNKIGGPAALLLAFAFSGLLHELALSIPVNSGYGLPLLYFMLQGVLVLVEKVFLNYNVMFLKNKIVASLWVFFWLVIPMPLLFHEQFIKEVLWPLAGLKLY